MGFTQALKARWSRGIGLSSAMADDEKIRTGTRYDALRMLGLIAAASGDLDDAEHLLRQALAFAPDHTPAMFELMNLSWPPRCFGRH